MLIKRLLANHSRLSVYPHSLQLVIPNISQGGWFFARFVGNFSSSPGASTGRLRSHLRSQRRHTTRLRWFRLVVWVPCNGISSSHGIKNHQMFTSIIYTWVCLKNEDPSKIIGFSTKAFTCIHYSLDLTPQPGCNRHHQDYYILSRESI